MTAKITLNLSDEVYRQAELLAQQCHRSVSEILVETRENFLLPTAITIEGSQRRQIPSNKVTRISPSAAPIFYAPPASELL